MAETNVIEMAKLKKVQEEKIANLMEEEAAKNNASPEDKKVMDFMTTDVPEEEKEHGLIAEERRVAVDPLSGKMEVLPEDGEEDYLDDIDNIELSPEEEAMIENMFKDADSKAMAFSVKQLQNYLVSQFSFLSESEVKIVSHIIDRVKNGEKFSVYNELPDSMKNFIKVQMGDVSDKTARNFAAKALINQIIEELTSFRSMEYLSKALDKKKNEMLDELGKEAVSGYITELASRYTLYQKAADKIRENPEATEEDLAKADESEKIANAFINSYTLQCLIDDVNNNRGKYKFKRIQLEKFTRECESFNMKYKKSIYTIKAIGAVTPVIMNLIGCDEYTAKLIVLAFIKYTLTFKPENPVEHTFMCNFIAITLLSVSVTSEDDMIIIDKLKEGLNTLAGLL